MKLKVTVLVVPFLLVCLEQTRAQLNLPEMPGPPYPDRYGNNRWGVKYDPRVHGRGRNEHSSPSTAGAWGGNGPQYSQSSRYRGGGAPPPPPSRSKWASALKPLVSIKTRFSKNKNKRNRRPPRPKGPPFDPTSDSFYKNSYTSKSIDGYVKNYLNTYNKVSQIAPNSPSDLVNIQNFAKPTNLRHFSRSGNRRSLSETLSSSSGSRSTGSLSDIYHSAAGLSDSVPTYRTLDPQENFFGPKISKKKSDFAKTLSTIYNDYKPGGENTASDVSTRSNSGSSSVAAAATDSVRSVPRDDDYPPSYFTIPPEPPSRPNRPRPPPRPSASSNSRPTLIERPFRRGHPPSSSRGPPHPPPKRYPSGPLSSIDLHDDNSGYSPGPPPSSFSSAPGQLDDYSDSMIITRDRDSPDDFSPSSPVTRIYSMSRPPLPSLYSAFDSLGLSEPPPPPPPYSSPFGGPHPPPPPPPPYLSPLEHAPPYPHPHAPHPHAPHPHAPPHPHPHAPMSNPFAPPISPVSYLPMAYPNLQILPVSVSSLSDDNGSKKSKRKKKPLPQHTPMNVIRGLLGRGERKTRHRDDDDDDEREIFRPAYAANIPVLSLPPQGPPPQYIYNPIVNTLAGPPPIDYRQPLYPNPHPQGAGLSYAYPHQQAGGGPHPHAGGQPYPPHGPPPLSPLGAGISALRDTLSILRDRPQQRQPPPPPPPPPPRYQQPSQSDNTQNINNNDVRNGAIGSPGGPITQHIQDWPRIFTAMGTSVDAVAGGIHAVRKEISKMTGKTMAKGIMMGGSAVHEVSKGMAHVITKLSTI